MVSSFYSGSGLTNTEQDSIESSVAAAEAAKVAAEAAKAAAETAEANAETAEANAETAEANSETAKTGSQTAQAASEAARDNAATSASQAASSAADAANDAGNSSTAAAAALASQTAAAGSASSAANDAAVSSNQATNSATSATASAASAAAALTSEQAAATSETNSAASAVQGASSASAASTSETNAAVSAASAATSLANIGSAESNAAASESAAATSATNSAASATQSASSAASASTDAATATTQANNSSASATSSSTSAAASLASKNAAATSETNSATSAANAASSASAAQTAQAATELAFDNFDDKFLGTFSSDPTTDNDGNALVVGSMYYNSSTSAIKFYNGTAWEAPETAASNSATSANTSATNAATSASNAASSATSASTSAASASSSLASFSGVYSSGTSDPTTNLNTGDLFFNETVGELKVYNGSAWQSGVTSGNATQSADGTMSSSDKTKLDAIEASADVTDTANVVAALTGGTNITIGNDGTISASGGDITVQDEGSALATAATALNFTGTGVTASGTGSTKTIAISSPTKADIDALNIDADTLDSLNSTQFLRSDANDTMTGSLTVSENLVADGGNIIIGDDAYSTGASYVGMKTSHMSGSSDYMIISGNSDGNTFISAKAGNDVHIRGGGNTSTYEIVVYPDQPPKAYGNTIWHAGNDGSNSGLDADTLDGIQGASFLRSDADDSTSSTLTVNTLKIGGGNNGRFFSDANGRTAFADGEFYIQSNVANTYLYATNTYLGASSGDSIYLRGNTMSGNSWSLTGAGALTLGSGVTLKESSDRADLLEIKSTSSTWGGLQITNTPEEGRWSFMTDGTGAGLYDDQNAHWHIWMVENSYTALYHDNVEKLRTLSNGVGTTGLTVGDVDANPHNTGGLQVSTINNEKIVLSGSTDPYIRWQESTTDRAYIQWTAGNDSLMIRNQQGSKIDLRGNNNIHVRLLSNEGTRRGSVYATATNEIGFLDKDDAWAYRHAADSLHEWRINNGIEMSLSSSTLDMKGNTITEVEDIGLRDRLYHDGDTDTYLEFDTNQINMVTAGSTEVTINSTGVRLGDNGNGYFQPVSGNYGSIQIDGGAHGGWEGYGIGGRVVFMHDNSSAAGIFNDVNNEWMFYGILNGETRMYYNGSSKIQTTSSGANISGNLNVTGSITGGGAGGVSWAATGTKQASSSGGGSFTINTGTANKSIVVRPLGYNNLSYMAPFAGTTNSSGNFTAQVAASSNNQNFTVGWATF